MLVQKKIEDRHPRARSEDLDAMIEASDPDAPPTDDEILGLILKELVHAPRRPSRTLALRER